MKDNKKPINNTINADDLWQGIGGHFDSLSQILHELIDNSVSNFRKNVDLPSHTILIHFDTSKAQDDEIIITVEDTGTGITNIDSALTLGDKKSQQTTLNEHGFGLKHALASANPKNNNWSITTRTEENIQKKTVSKISSSYKLTGFEFDILENNVENYPTRLKSISTGTIIRFSTSVAMFRTIGRYGTKDEMSLLYYLKENLGFIYSGIIHSGIAKIRISINDKPKLIVNGLEPFWEKTIEPGNGMQIIDLGEMGNGESSGEVTISYKFGTINKRQQTSENEKIIYYNANMQTSGVEIRLNGRVIKNNILTDIWEKTYQHNRFNSFLVIIDLISDDKDSLPPTRSSKNGFKKGDYRLIGLYNWIRKYCDEPYEDKNKRDEENLFNDLKILKKKSLEGYVQPPLIVETERKILKSTDESIRIDMVVAFEDKYIIYKGKKGKVSASDLYQLKLFWDTSIFDGQTPTEAILLASDNSSVVQDLIALNNSLKDINGNNYNFKLKKWIDEGIDYPSNVI
ncbi:ATP-binding protein [Corallibacter sp.]|uniref:ATP-binding protein n=1 Tax=Corallibacter sp. TaxID=2038084 RepID=UPI003A9526C4